MKPSSIWKAYRTPVHLLISSSKLHSFQFILASLSNKKKYKGSFVKMFFCFTFLFSLLITKKDSLVFTLFTVFKVLHRKQWKKIDHCFLNKTLKTEIRVKLAFLKLPRSQTHTKISTHLNWQGQWTSKIKSWIESEDMRR